MTMTGKHKRIVLGLFAVLFLYALFFTPSGDDMERLRFVEYHLPRLFSLIPDQYRNLNGRVIGNFLSFALIRPVWIRALVKAFTVSVIAHSLWRIGRCKSFGSLLFTFFLVTAMPLAIHVQVYAWSAGFFNYTIPMAIVLWFVARMRSDRIPRPWQGAMAGFTACLFVEHVTVVLGLVAAGILIFHWIGKGKVHQTLFAFALGVLAGALVMFASPGYRDVIEGDDWYRRVPTTWSSIEFQLFKNMRRFGPYVLARQGLLAVLLFGGVFAVLKSTTERVLWGFLVAGLLTLFWPLSGGNRFVMGMESQPWITVLVHQLVHASILLFLWFRVTPLLHPADQNMMRGSIAAWLALYAPLLIVQPIGPRNYYGATMALVLIVLLVLKQAGAFRLPYIRQVSLLLLMALLIWRGGIHYSNTRVYLARDTVIREAMNQGSHAVMLEPFPYLRYMHGDQVEGLDQLYYYKQPGDLYFYIRP